MRGDYKPDEFTENDVLAALDNAGLKHGRGGGRYILAQCPLHEDKHESCQIYTDDWFVKCHAGCEGGRFHITKAFPELRGQNNRSGSGDRFRGSQQNNRIQSGAKKVTERQYKKIDLMDLWKSLPEIPADHYFKDIPIDELNGMGWRWDEQNNRYFIPYFSRSKTSIPFGQWRNLSGNVRFNFWKDAKPTMYGTWNLEPGEKIFLVEGASDAAVLEYCAIPWIATPSASQPELVKAMGKWAAEQGIEIVFAGDRDDAGEKVREALDEVTSYRVRQPREPYKDWGDMYEAEGIKSVINWCHVELFPGDELLFPEIEPGYKKSSEKTDVEKVMEVFPGAVELEIVNKKEEPKHEQLPF